MCSRSRGRRRRPDAADGDAVATLGPFERLDAEWREQRLMREVRQRHAGAFGDQMAEQSDCAAGIDPTFARRGDERPIEDEAVTVRRSLHGDLAVLRIGVRKLLIPLHAECHVQCVHDSEVRALRIGREIGILGELCQQRRVRRRHQAAIERDTVQQPHDALGHRAQIMQRVGAEGHAAEWCAPAFIGVGEIALQQNMAGAACQNDMHIRHQARANRVIEPIGDVVRLGGGNQ